MSCGNTLSVFQEDPQDMPGQGLARTDNYRSTTAAGEYNSLIDTMLGQQNTLLDAEGRYKPQYIAQDAANTKQALGANLDLVGQYLPQIQQLRRSADPQATQLQDLVMQQAIEEMLAGGNLTPAQQRAVQQNSRAAFAARGMGGSNAALADELLAQYDLGEQAKAARRQFAMSALGLNQNLSAGYTPQDWLSFATSAGRTATSTLLPASAQFQLLAQVYGENQANNRAQAGLETQIGMHQADIWNDWGKTATGAAVGGGSTGGGGGGGGSMGGMAGGSTGSGFGMGNSSAGWNMGGSNYGSFGRGKAY